MKSETNRNGNTDKGYEKKILLPAACSGSFYDSNTGVSDEGDYLMTITDTSDAGAWQMDGEVLYAYDFTYRTTLAEEQELTEALKAIEAQIPWGDTADEEMHAVRGAHGMT